MGMAVTFTVAGEPVGQGQISHLGKGRPAIHTNAARLLPWRQAIGWAARAAMHGAAPFDCPVLMRAVFTMPARAKPKFTDHPAVPPDLDHLIRAVCDAVTGIVVTDDARIVAVSAYKQHAGPYPPGVRLGFDPLSQAGDAPLGVLLGHLDKEHS